MTGPARDFTIRKAARADLETCRTIERAASHSFAGTRHAHLVGSEPDTIAELEPALASGTIWLAEDDRGAALGFLKALVIAEGLHIDELDVLPAAQSRGIGRALVFHAEAHANARTLPALWLRTFRDVPWNAPFYARLGFEIAPDGEPASMAPTFAAHERESGLDPVDRCTMVKRLLR
ncbi:MAG: GNAT family N-acetyltransferase [Pseudomonadota bacterium]